MSKRKHHATIAKFIVTAKQAKAEAQAFVPPPTIENILRANLDEMETIRTGLAQQQLELLNRRGYPRRRDQTNRRAS
jgi:hypothetical protein